MEFPTTRATSQGPPRCPPQKVLADEPSSRRPRNIPFARLRSEDFGRIRGKQQTEGALKARQPKELCFPKGFAESCPGKASREASRKASREASWKASRKASRKASKKVSWKASWKASRIASRNVSRKASFPESFAERFQGGFPEGLGLWKASRNTSGNADGSIPRSWTKAFTDGLVREPLC